MSGVRSRSRRDPAGAASAGADPRSGEGGASRSGRGGHSSVGAGGCPSGDLDAERAPQDRGGYLAAPRVRPPLDPGFRPAVLARRRAEAAIRATPGARRVGLAVEQPGGLVLRRDTWVLPDVHPGAAASHWFCERLVKALLWTCGGSRVYVHGPDALVRSLERHYSEDATGRFDARMMGDEIFGRPFEVVPVARDGLPAPHEGSLPLGGHLDGCRIGFDLGASDRKVAAVIDGEVVFSEEVRWDPAHQADPQWHFEEIMDGLRRAAAHLPRVDAIGGSSAGAYVDNEVRVASLFRSVPRELFERRVRGLFREIRHAWGDIPLVVVNDGEVTALAGAMLAGVRALLGIAMGSSEAGGYVTRDGGLSARLDELAFVPIDHAPAAPADEWSGDLGCGVQYLSQQATGRLLPVAGIEVDPALGLPERLVRLQELMAADDQRAAQVYLTVGTYLGYALLEYASLYDVDHILLLGRVMTGRGGDLIVERARTVLQVEDPAAQERIAFHLASERDKRHGQAVAAASLPVLG